MRGYYVYTKQSFPHATQEIPTQPERAGGHIETLGRTWVDKKARMSNHRLTLCDAWGSFCFPRVCVLVCFFTLGIHRGTQGRTHSHTQATHQAQARLLYLWEYTGTYT